MSEDNFNNQMAEQLKSIKIPVVEVPETTLPGAKDLGAKAAETFVESEEEKNCFLIDEGVAKLYAEEFVEKTKAENKIKKFQAEIIKNIADSIKNGDGQSQNEIALGVFEEAIKKTKTKDTKNKIEILASYYRTKIEEEKKQKESESGENQKTETKLGKSKPTENESVKPQTEQTKKPIEKKVPETKSKESRAGFKIIQPAKQEKGQDLKNEFEQKYPDILKTKRFNDKGEELYIQEYDKGKIKCFITENGKTFPSYLSLTELDDALREYARVGESIKKIIPAKEINQEEKPKPEIENKEKKEEIEGETQGLERFCKVYYEMYEKRANWQHFSEKEKKYFLSSVVGSHARKTIETKSKFLKNLKEEEKEKIIEQVKQKVIQK